jgi:hypothetical protein
MNEKKQPNESDPFNFSNDSAPKPPRDDIASMFGMSKSTFTVFSWVVPLVLLVAFCILYEFMPREPGRKKKENLIGSLIRSIFEEKPSR